MKRFKNHRNQFKKKNFFSQLSFSFAFDFPWVLTDFNY